MRKIFALLLMAVVCAMPFARMHHHIVGEDICSALTDLMHLQHDKAQACNSLHNHAGKAASDPCALSVELQSRSPRLISESAYSIPHFDSSSISAYLPPVVPQPALSELPDKVCMPQISPLAASFKVALSRRGPPVA